MLKTREKSLKMNSEILLVGDFELNFKTFSVTFEMCVKSLISKLITISQPSSLIQVDLTDK